MQAGGETWMERVEEEERNRVGNGEGPRLDEGGKQMRYQAEWKCEGRSLKEGQIEIEDQRDATITLTR